MLEDIELPRDEVVKIALIDKGVDTEDPDVRAIERGQSFHRDSRESTDGAAWDPEFLEWNSRPPIHWIHMAICIQKICPMAKLYVARMDDSDPESQEFTLDLQSRYAVKWAREMGVHIISMSSSFKAKTGGFRNEELNDFRTAISSVKGDNILLFASLNDSPNISPDDYYPCGLADVFKIGSETKWGDKAANSLIGADFILPGDNIGVGGMHKISGSSIATAFAVGLAGLMLFTLAAYRDPKYSEYQDNDDTKRDELLKNARIKEGMNKIFNILSGNRQGIKNPDLWLSLDDKFPDEVDKTDPGPYVRDFVRGIFPM
ncbi:hypothetical protein BGW36DRAFT_421890 [Talaromyces proteolyticus]|uniref:Peptidase S8/S53 domain-containing protein n=1 Tax=Talaromyces proteolyticus TaxID=1131652 RepID=A0AAD4Q666_9EURO|nr:uncharacterized protein BGW36DRAFT_421890 [Talaromyces proteolyticus]KAH8705328.1 hypothetical protein BGW36DRAFT_421890 [Talaromyces proteolyticus]